MYVASHCVHVMALSLIGHGLSKSEIFFGFFNFEPQAAVGEHFTKLHSRDHMRITAIQAAPVDLNRRLEAEARIIFKLGTHQGHGLNTDFKLQ